MVFALAVAGCAGSPEDAFVGRYEGTYDCNGAFDDGTPYSEGPADQSIRIDRALDGSIFIAGSCSIPLEVVSARRAEVAPTSGNSTLSDGTPAVIYIDGGVVEHNGAGRLVYSIRFIIDGPEWTVSTTCTFDGYLAR